MHKLKNTSSLLKRILRTLRIFILTLQLGKAEESSILEGASVTKSGSNTSSDSPNALIDGNFLTIWHDWQSDKFNVDLAKQYSIKSIFLVNRNDSADWKKEMGIVNLMVGPSADSLVTCYESMTDTGFYELTKLCAGTLVQLNRVGKLKGGNIYAVNELRLFQTPNLIKTF